MILQRIAIALRDQDWTIVFIEFALVVAGVLIALEVDRYNEQQKAEVEEIVFLKLMREDLRQDIDDIRVLMDSYQQVEDFGLSTMEVLSEDGCETECWQKVVAAFHASQWLDASLSRTTYEEMKRRGLPTNPTLKKKLSDHYAIADQRNVTLRELPKYRELIRSVIPPDVQKKLWANCFAIEGKTQYFLGDCAPQISEAMAREIVVRMQSYDDLQPTLTFWLGNIALIWGTLPSAIEDAENAIELVSAAIPE